MRATKKRITWYDQGKIHGEINNIDYVLDLINEGYDIKQLTKTLTCLRALLMPSINLFEKE